VGARVSGALDAEIARPVKNCRWLVKGFVFPRSIEAPHHSIIGDRGKGDTPARTAPNQLTETLSELPRILRLHLITSDQ